MSEPVEPRIPRASIEFTPQEKYSQMLTKNTILTKRIRQAERLPVMDGDQLQQEKHDEHTKLLALAESLGLSNNQVAMDLLLNEGNLSEYLLPDVPLIPLPLTYFSYSSDFEFKRPENSEFSHIAGLSVKSPAGDKIASSSRPVFFRRKGDEKDIQGDTEVINKWNSGNYSLIVFAGESFGVRDDQQELFTTRLARMKQFAIDLGLNTVISSNGHAYDMFDTANIVYGVEVPNDRIAEIGNLLNHGRNKYLLTDDQKNNPYKKEYLMEQEIEYLLKKLQYFVAIKTEYGAKDIGYEDWIKILRLTDVMKEKGYDTRGNRPLSWLRKGVSISINTALKEAKKQNPDAAKEIEFLWHSNESYLKTLTPKGS